MKELFRHLPHYLSLAAIILVSLWGLLTFAYDPHFQTAIAFSLTISFVVWGIIHHHIHEDLSTIIILEYLGTAILGLVVLLSVINKS